MDKVLSHRELLALLPPQLDRHIGISNDKVIDDSVAFCEYMLHEQHIALVPGAGFGADAHVRVSYAVSMENIEKSMDRFEKGLQAL